MIQNNGQLYDYYIYFGVYYIYFIFYRIMATPNTGGGVGIKYIILVTRYDLYTYV